MNSIYDRLDGSVKFSYIREAIDILCNELVESLSEHEAVTIRNFGTLNPYLHLSHAVFNIQSERIEHCPQFWSVKFHAHDSFQKLLLERREDFKKK